MSLKRTIYEYINKKGTLVHKGEIGRLAVNEWGYENENCGRRCRELENEGKIERRLIKNPKTGISEVWYKVKGAFDVQKWNEQFYGPMVEESKQLSLM